MMSGLDMRQFKYAPVSFLFVLCRDPSVLLRMLGGVGAGGEKPPATRLDDPLLVMRPHADNFNCLDIV